MAMKFEEFFLRSALKVQEKYRLEWELENHKMSPSWQDLYAAQQRLRAATVVVEAIQATLNEALGDTE